MKIIRIVTRLIPLKVKILSSNQLRQLGYRPASYSDVDFHNRQIKMYMYMNNFFELTREIPGVIIECGFGHGHSFLCLASLAELHDTTLIGFDSFQGFPTPTEHDVSGRNPKKSEWSVRTLTEAWLQIRQFGLKPSWINSKVKLIPGFVEDSIINNLPNEPIRLLHVDLDLYSAYKVTLENLFPLVAEGGVVLFDEYNEVKWPGATKAVDDYFRDSPYKIQRHSSGKYFVQKASN